MCLLVFILILLFFSTVGLFYELIYLTLDNVICDLQQGTDKIQYPQS